MSDIFREVDEDIRQEKYRRLWDRFGLWVIALAVLIVVGTGGYRGWLYWENTRSQAAGDTFMQAIKLSNEQKYEEAAALYGELDEALGGYPALASFRRATDLANSGQADQAIDAFDALSRDDSLMQALRDAAALRAAFLAVDTQDYAAIADRAEPLTGNTSPFRASAREVLALSAWKTGDIDAARRWISALDDDQTSPVDVTRRVALLSDVIRANNGGVVAESEGSNQ
ncbi:tetratricopeptide repeat protein [Rhodobacterales bacterium]|nr:tetratricopeptide repeat protein [Rhodobacterales bacterium]